MVYDEEIVFKHLWKEIKWEKRGNIMAQLSRQKFDVFIMNWYVDGLHGKCGAAFPGFLYYAAALAASRSITG